MPETPEDELLGGNPFDDEPAPDDTPGPEAPDAELRGFFPDLLRRTLTLGFTGLFLTEEAARKVLGPSVPREWVQYVLSQSEKTRTDLVDRMSHEFGRVISALDPVEVLRRLFDGQSIEVSAKIRFFLDQEKSRETRLHAAWRKDPGRKKPESS